MLRYRPQFRYTDKAAQPLNLAEAAGIAPGLTPVYADRADLMVDVETPLGETLGIEDPALLHLLGAGISEKHTLTLLRADRAMTDCRPVSLFSVQTARQLGEELGTAVDQRRFRANDRQLDPLRLRELHQPFDVGRGDRHIRGVQRRAGISRSTIDSLD